MVMHIRHENYIEPSKAIEALMQAGALYEEAQASLIDALSSGELRAIGLEVKVAHITRGPLEDVQFIPIQFWVLATIKDQNKWRWDMAIFTSCDKSIIKYHAANKYKFVKFHKRDVDGLVKPQSGKDRPGRPMSKAWPEWVAELTSAVEDGDVKGTMRQSDIQQVVADRLSKRGIVEPSKSTINRTLEAVVRRLRE
jgi:hypothetical protein